MDEEIVEAISGYMGLERSGKMFIGLCPFHEELNPSFTVNPETQTFHCFGCRKNGTVEDFKRLMAEE